MTIIKEGSVSTDLSVNTYFGSKKDIIRALRECVIAENDATNMYEKVTDAIENYIKAYENNTEVTSLISVYNKIMAQVKEIADEEKKHIGEFQKLISMLDNNEVTNYKLGVKEV
jgi:rubrerythrin